MRALPAAAVLCGALACGRPATPLYPAGSTYDDGHGELALASMKLLTPAEEPATPRTGEPEGEPDPCGAGDAEPGGGGSGDGTFGGSTYANHVVPDWRTVPVDRRPRYRQVQGLRGAIEGVITWRGAVPGKLATSCGAIEPLAVGADRALAGVLVYIEKVSVGRALPSDARQPSVGGLLVKRGCALGPAVQVATPLPSALIVHGDATRTKLRVAPPAGPAKTYELREAGRIGLQVPAGVTRIDAADGSFASAWVIGLDSPYYALTDDRGRFRLDELAAGAYEVTIWQPPVPAVAGGALVYGAPIVVKRAVRVEGARTARLDVALGPGPGPGPGPGR
jgi:hypothetical protein